MANPKCRIILSTRDTLDHKQWRRAFPVRLSPLSDDQQYEFIDKWFTAEPTSRNGLHKWLKSNGGMRDAARTPLVAALLCSLYRARADMPDTEIDLYKKRFELLLGRWERAKGIAPLSGTMRRRYLHFLRLIAFRMHKAETRSMRFAD